MSFLAHPLPGPLPAVSADAVPADVAAAIREACQAWLVRSPSADTRSNYSRDLAQFLAFVGAPADRPEALVVVRPHQVAAWRDSLRDAGLANSSVARKLTVLRSLYSYLRTYGYVGANPAHPDFVAAPPVPQDGKTLGLSPEDCRRLLDAPPATPAGVRDAALLAVLAYTGCRVGEVVRLKVGGYRQTGAHRVLEVLGKGGKERRVPLHPEAVERVEAWLDAAGTRGDMSGPCSALCSRPGGPGPTGSPPGRSPGGRSRSWSAPTWAGSGWTRGDGPLAPGDGTDHGPGAGERRLGPPGFRRPRRPADHPHLHPQPGPAEQVPGLRPPVLTLLSLVRFSQHRCEYRLTDFSNHGFADVQTCLDYLLPLYSINITKL